MGNKALYKHKRTGDLFAIETDPRLSASHNVEKQAGNNANLKSKNAKLMRPFGQLFK